MKRKFYLRGEGMFKKIIDFLLGKKKYCLYLSSDYCRRGCLYLSSDYKWRLFGYGY